MTDVTYCAAGCKTRNAAGDLERVQTSDSLALCDSCADRLWTFVRNIGRNYRELRRHMIRTSTPEVDDESAHTKTPVAPAPVRLEVVDLTDERHIKSVDNRRVVANVRGALGIVQRWSHTVRSSRRYKTPDPVTMTTELTVLERNFEWIVCQPWAGSMFHDLRKLNSRILDAVGIQRQRPLGRCDAVVQDDENGPHVCGGPIFILRYTLGVVCGSCQRQYGRDELESRWPASLISRA